MEYQEYMDTLREQITNRHARERAAQEIDDHITEQAKAYEADGMAREEALQEAVRQMGDPVETGSALNRIHRPHTPWQMLLLALAVTIVSIAVQGAIIAQLNGVGWQTEQFFELVLFHVVGFGIIFALLYADYTFFARHIYAFYAGYLCLAAMVMYLIYHQWFTGSFQWIAGGYYTNYTIQSMQPLLFAGVLYRNRNRGIRGIFTSVAIVCATTTLLIVMEDMWVPTMHSSAVYMENALILYAMLLVAAWRRMFAADRKKQILALLGGGVTFGVLVFLTVFRSGYQRERLAALISAAGSQQGYHNVRIREAVGTFTLIGTRSFSDMAVGETHYEGVYLLNDIFSYFGIVAGLAVLAVLTVFAVYAFRVSFRQSSRIGFLIGLACGCSIAVRLSGYVAINFGYALYYTTSVPFLGYHWLNILCNSVYVGLLLCVARNTMTIGEAADGPRSFQMVEKRG